MHAKIHGGTFVIWRGTAGEDVICRSLPVPLSDYDAEPWGGLLIVASQADHSGPEILETDNLRRDIPDLSARIGNRDVFWISEKDIQQRATIKTKLGTYPTYVG